MVSVVTFAMNVSVILFLQAGDSESEVCHIDQQERYSMPSFDFPFLVGHDEGKDQYRSKDVKDTVKCDTVIYRQREDGRTLMTVAILNKPS